jgi:GNAT superfamily N-acetyltransferase
VDRDLLDLCDWNHEVASVAMFGASRTGGALESHDLWITHCGFPQRAFNCAFLKHPSERVEAAIEATERAFTWLGLPFSFLCRGDRAASCTRALGAAGYLRHEEIPVMVLDPIRDGGKPVAGLEIRPVESAADLADFQRVAFEGFGLPGAAASLFLTEALLALPNVRLCLGRIEGRAVCTSLVVATGAVAGIYWVATAEGQRRRGLGEAVTWAALGAGRHLGCTVGNLQASRLGAPVYARMGFETRTHYVRFQEPGPQPPRQEDSP